VLATSGIAVYLGRYGSRSSAVRWFRAYLLVRMVYSLMQGLSICTANPAIQSWWLAAYAAAAIVAIVVLFIFVAHFVNKEHLLNSQRIQAALLVTSLTLMWLAWHSDFAANQLNRVSLADVDPSTRLLELVLFSGGILPIIMVWIYYRQLEDSYKRLEVRLVLIALFLPVAASALSQGILPAVLASAPLPIAPLFGAISGVIIVYALTRYGLYIFNLNTISGNVIQIMPGGLVILDHSETIQYVNEGAIKMLGFTTGELVGSSLGKLLPKGTIKEVLRLAPTIAIVGQETTLLTAKGSLLPVSLNLTRVQDHGKVTNTLIAFTDVSQLKQAQDQLAAEKATVEMKVIERTHQLMEARAQLEASIRSLPFGFALINPKGQIVFHNQVLSTLFNRHVPDDPAETPEALEQVSADFHEAFDLMADLQAVLRRGHPIERSVELGPRFYRFLLMPVLGDAKTRKATGVVMVMEDTTDGRALERSRDEFFSIASHELRTPLTAIRGNAQMILEYYKDQLKDPSMREMVDDIHDGSVRLIDIVNDFLDVSRLEQKKLEFKNVEFDIAELIQKTLREYQVTGSRGHLYLQLEPPTGPQPLVHADPERVRQILINLIGNALKFTDKGGVKIFLAAADLKTMHISVADSGRGIPVESQHLLFRKFQQATNNILTRDNTKGSGLGLYISALLAKGVGGKLYLEKSVVGEGSTFTLELPLASLTAPRTRSHG
jgi:PAS domain S-box-containing protein